MNLISDENSELTKNCYPICESLFDEVFNDKIWHWYHELGLISSPNSKKLMYIVDGKMMFDESIKKQLISTGFISSILSSIKFSHVSTKWMDKYDPHVIENMYISEFDLDYTKLSRSDLIKKFDFFWDALVFNFRYSILANLVIQYKLSPVVPKQYTQDVLASRFNAIIDLSKNKISRSHFDHIYGFCSSYDYDLSSKRYSEISNLELKITDRVIPTSGYHNFREHVKMSIARLVALVRRVSIVLQGDDFIYFYKHEISTNESPLIEPRKIGHMLIKKNSNSERGVNLTGVCLSGAGEIEGEVKILNDIQDLNNSYKGYIIVTDEANPELVIAMRSVKAIITQKSGTLSHLAIVAKERNFPLIGKVENALSSLKDGDKIKINVKSGEITLQ